jgi:hypothetical protein
MSLTKHSLAESLVSDIPAGHGKTDNLFFECGGFIFAGVLPLPYSHSFTATDPSQLPPTVS